MTFRRLLLFLLLLSGLPLSPAAAAQEDILARALVPKEKNPLGEVRLLVQDDTLVLQTLLRSKVLKRVMGAIASKEKTFWQGKKGQDDSLLYIAALRKSYDEIWERYRAREDRENHYQEMLIEFGISEKNSWLEVARSEFKGEVGEFEIKMREPLQKLELTRDYMLGSLFEISRDSLGLTSAELLYKVKTVGPQFDWLSKEWVEIHEKDAKP